MQYLLNQIGLDSDETSLLEDVSSLMGKYHIENYKRLGMPAELDAIILVLHGKMRDEE